MNARHATLERTPERRRTAAHAVTALVAAALLAAAGSGHAGPRHDWGERHDTLVRARVIAAEPIYQTINEPRTQCWSETVGYAPRPSRDSGGAVIGAIAGGLIGSTVGKGNGRVAAAAVGAATGAVIGDRAAGHAYAAGPRQIERCETTDSYRRVVAGYDVRYRYLGREYRTELPYDPGRFVALRVNVQIVDEPGHDRFPDYSDRR
jgi:uncharacterized protein YcfJ